MKKLLVTLAVFVIVSSAFGQIQRFSPKDIREVGTPADIRDAELVFGRSSNGRIAANQVPTPPGAPETNSSGVVVVRDAGFLNAPQKEIVFVLTRPLGAQGLISFRMRNVQNGNSIVTQVYSFPEGVPYVPMAFMVWQGAVLMGNTIAVDFEVGTYDPNTFQSSVSRAEVAANNGFPVRTIPFMEGVTSEPPSKGNGIMLTLHGQFLPTPLKVLFWGTQVLPQAVTMGPVGSDGAVHTVTIDLSLDRNFATFPESDYDISVEQFGWSHTIQYHYRNLFSQKG